MLTTERRLFPHNPWQRPVLTFRNGVPAGFAEDANISPVSPMGLLAFFYPAAGVLVVDNSVCCLTTWGRGQSGFPQLRRSGLETMGILGVSHAMQQSFEEKDGTSQGNAISSFLISIGDELYHQGLWKATKKAVIYRLC